MKNKKALYLTQAAMIAALYVVLTMIANAFGLASGSIQGPLFRSAHRAPLPDTRRSTGTVHRLSCSQPRDRRNAAGHHFRFTGHPAWRCRYLSSWKSSRKALCKKDAFCMVIPAAPYRCQCPDHPACIKIRLRHHPDVVFRSDRNNRRNHLLWSFRHHFAVCTQKI